MIAATGVGNRDLYLFFAGLLVLILYGLIRASGRDPIRRGTSPEATWSPWEALLLIIVTLFLQALCAGMAAGLGIESRAERILASWVAPMSVCLYVYWSYLRIPPPEGAKTGPRLLEGGRGLLTGVLFWVGSIPIVLCVYVAWAHLYTALGGMPREQEILRVLEAAPLPFFLTAVIFAPLAEEVLFRGLLFPSLKRFGGTAAAILLSGALFALAHYDLTVGPALFTMGVFLALSYEMTGTLWAPIGFHAAFNTWTFLGKMT